MADYINNVAAGDDYTAACTIGPDFGAKYAVVTIANNPALMQFAVGEPGNWRWTDEREFQSIPQSFRVGNVIGVKVRNASLGNVARVLAVLAGDDDPDFQSGVPFTGVLGAGGGVAPGGATVEVDHNGVAISTQPKVDFEDANGLEWTITDDPGFTRAKIQRAAVPAALIYNSVNLNLPNAAVTAMALNSAQFNQRAMFNAGTPGRLTAPVAGIYRFSGRIWIAANGVGVERFGRLRVNGATLLDDDRKLPWAGDWNTLGVTSIVQMAVGDYVELCGFQDSGGVLAVLGGAGTTQLAGEQIA